MVSWGWCTGNTLAVLFYKCGTTPQRKLHTYTLSLLARPTQQYTTLKCIRCMQEILLLASFLCAVVFVVYISEVLVWDPCDTGVAGSSAKSDKIDPQAFPLLANINIARVPMG